MFVGQDLETVVTAVQRRWGTRALRRLTRQETLHPLPHIPTGLPQLDAGLGRGGLMLGTMTEMLGKPTSGATTLALKSIAAAQSQELTAVFLDLPHTFDPDYAAQCGVDMDRLLLIRPQAFRDAMDILHTVISSRSAGIAVLDLFGCRDLPQAGFEIRRIATVLNGSPTALVLLSPSSFAIADDPVSCFASIRLLVQRQEWSTRVGRVNGYIAWVRVLKNHFGPSEWEMSIKISLGNKVEVTVL